MPMKIVHTITKLELGGAQQNTLYTLNNLRKSFTGYLLCGKGGFLDEEAKKSDRFLLRFCPFLKRQINPVLDFLAFFWMYFYFSGIKPDIVHTHSSKAGILSRWAAKFAGVPVIIHTFHGFGFNPLQGKAVKVFFIRLEKMTAKITAKLIAVSHANVRKALSLGIGKREQYTVIRSGIDPKKFEKKAEFVNIKKELGLNIADRLVGNISCFKPQKGLSDFVEACRRLREKGNYNFILVGDGNLRRKLEKQVREAGLKDCFFMLGWRKDIENILPEFDILLHTSYFEGLPRVFLEAMASKVPVVATRVDGATDVIENGVSGWLVPAYDIDGMVKYSYKILEDDSLRKKMAQEGRIKLKREFNIKIMADMLNELYEEFAGEIK